MYNNSNLTLVNNPYLGSNTGSILGYSGYSSNGICITQPIKAIKAPNMQAKVAIFKVERDEEGTVTSSSFLKEIWVEKLPNVSLELTVVKELEPDFDPKTIVIKEINTVSFY